jgi:hypothetical protein
MREDLVALFEGRLAALGELAAAIARRARREASLTRRFVWLVTSPSPGNG